MKRVFDSLIILTSAPIWLPVLLSLWILVRIKMGSPAIFAQQRPGRYGLPFRMYKFRSMTDARDKLGNPLQDSERLTPFGHWLRGTSLDELPELINVLKGDMSLVGPRPLLMQYLPRYTQRQARRHEVLPGITGWAQVNGRNAISWEQRLEYDVWYVDHRSFLLDLQIIFKTLFKVVRRDGTSAEGHATMPEFQGSRETNRGPGSNT